jgi:hypothetical protein
VACRPQAAAVPAWLRCPGSGYKVANEARNAAVVHRISA